MMSLQLLNFSHQTWQSSSWISLAATLRKAGLEESQRCSPTAITGSWPHWWCAATWRRQLHDVSAQHLSSLSHCCVLMQIGDTDSNLQHKDLNEKASWWLNSEKSQFRTGKKSGWESVTPDLRISFSPHPVKQPSAYTRICMTYFIPSISGFRMLPLWNTVHCMNCEHNKGCLSIGMAFRKAILPWWPKSPLRDRLAIIPCFYTVCGN